MCCAENSSAFPMRSAASTSILIRLQIGARQKALLIMLVLVDTPIWSLALCRKNADLNPREQRFTQALRELIQDGRAQLVGPVRQELLSGLREEASFKKLRDQLRAFEQVSSDFSDYEEAAQLNNHCRARGIAGSAIGFLICAAALRRGWQDFTTDPDFLRYSAVFPLRLYKVI
jgi:predicted nucleic acid-binding protein